jgi:ribonuclease P protein component
MFERLGRDGRRAGTEHLWCRYLDEPSAGPPRVAFAIGRRVGPAVVRNRVRRRLRAIVAASADLMPTGSLLIGAKPTVSERTFAQLQTEVRTLLQRAVSR